MSQTGQASAAPRLRRPARRGLTGYWHDIVTAWRVPAVKRGLLATTLLFLGSLTPAYLPQNSPWWDAIRTLGWDTGPAKVIGTALVVAAVVLLVDAWFRLRPGLYLDYKHWAVLLIWSLPLLLAPPIFSHDAYSYAAQGWLLHNGLNPYETPVSVLPGPFADQVSWMWRYTPAPYGPLSLQISHLMVLVGGLNPYYSTLLMRIPALIGVGLIVYFLPRLAARLGADVQLAAWFSTINPLLVIDLVGGMHNDALMLGLIILALWMTHVRPQRFWLGAIIIGVAAAIKQPALLAAYPVALIGLPWQWNTHHVLNRIARAVISSVIAIGTFAADLGRQRPELRLDERHRRARTGGHPGAAVPARRRSPAAVRGGRPPAAGQPDRRWVAGGRRGRVRADRRIPGGDRRAPASGHFPELVVSGGGTAGARDAFLVPAVGWAAVAADPSERARAEGCRGGDQRAARVRRRQPGLAQRHRDRARPGRARPDHHAAGALLRRASGE